MPQLNKRALGRIQRLCCLGIGSEMLMPDLMLEVTRLVPFRNGWFGWVGPNSEFTNVYSPDPMSSQQYWMEYHNTRREMELITTFREFLREPVTEAVYHPFWHNLRVDYHTFLSSDYYNDIFRPAGIYDALAMIVQEQGRSRGVLYLWRAETEPGFGPGDVLMLESIVGWAPAAGPTAAKPLGPVRPTRLLARTD
jgi:hypothetical protein